MLKRDHEAPVPRGRRARELGHLALFDFWMGQKMVVGLSRVPLTVGLQPTVTYPERWSQCIYGVPVRAAVCDFRT